MLQGSGGTRRTDKSGQGTASLMRTKLPPQVRLNFRYGQCPAALPNRRRSSLSEKRLPSKSNRASFPAPTGIHGGIFQHTIHKRGKHSGLGPVGIHSEVITRPPIGRGKVTKSHAV